MINKKINNKNFLIFPNIDKAENYILDNIVNLQNKTDNLITLSGGKSPEGLYRKLSKKLIKCDNFEFLLSDERYYGDQTNHSNFYFINKIFSDFIDHKKKLKLIHLIEEPYVNESPNHNPINKRLFNLNIPSLSILSIGFDGHVASLFDCEEATINELKNYTTTQKKYLNFYRISLSYSYILSSKKIILFAFGANKNNVIERLKKNNVNKEQYLMPVEYILKYFKNKIFIVCDNMAFYNKSHYIGS